MTLLVPGAQRVLHQIDQGPVRMREASAFWRHPCFDDLGLINARFRHHRYDLHTHPTYVVALITAGCERINIGRQTVLAPAGTIAVVNPEEWHDGEAGAEEGWSYRTLYPSVPLLTAIAGELGKDCAPTFSRALIEDGALARALAKAHRVSTSVDAIGAETSMLLALRQLILCHGDRDKRLEAIEHTGSHRRFAVYRQLIERNLAAKFDLQGLADAAGVTRFQVIRDFRKASGLAPAAFIRDRRSRHAAALIRQGATLADAAAAAGFSDQSHLSRTFRATNGVTPGMFRRAWRD